MVFEFIRQLTCNFSAIEKYIPEKGTILDVGCGHGILSDFLVEKSPAREVLGIDPSAKKIALAKKKFRNSHNPTFRKAYLSEIKGKFTAVILVDVLYLLPPREKLKMLKVAKKLLAKNGKLILVINGKEPRWIFNILQIQEKIMTQFLKITHTDYDKVYFEDTKEALTLIKKSGLIVERMENITSFLPYPHVLFVAKSR